MPRRPIVIYAATGYTGRLIAAELPERGDIAQAAIELTAPGFTQSGALAPAQAVDPRAFLDGLAAIGVRWRVEAPQQARTEVPA